MEQYELAQSCFKQQLAISSTENYKNSLFLYLWPDILQENYPKVDKIISQLDLHGKFPTLSSRVQFWIAYASEMVGKKNLAGHYYDAIIDSDPVSYYSVMSMKRLKTISKKTQQLPSGFHLANPAYAWEHIPLAEYSNDLLKTLKRIQVFTKLNQGNLVSHETRHINTAPISNLLRNPTMYSRVSYQELREKITLHIAFILSHEKSYLKSFTLIHGGIKTGRQNINPSLIKALFPSPYISQIASMAPRDIDPYIILSLIRQESAFNPSAKSRVGARGLMQLMPGTARRIIRRLPSRALRNPQTNLKVGIRYFIKLYQKYNKNLIYTLAAYNAGENRVKRWRRQYFKDHSMLHVIEAIPFKETNLYVKLILRNLFFYKLINGHRNDSEAPHKIFDVLVVKS